MKKPYNDVRQVVSLNPLTLTEDAPNVVEFYNFAFRLGKVCCYANKLLLSGDEAITQQVILILETFPCVVQSSHIHS